MRFRIFLLSTLVALPVFAQERIDLSVVETKPSNTQYRLERLTIQPDNPGTLTTDEGWIHIELRGQNNELVSCNYNAASTPTGKFLGTALNKTNLSAAYNNNATTGSLTQRIFHRLIVMGESAIVCDKTLIGTLVGVPQ